LSRIEGDSGIGIGIGMVLYGCSVSVMVLWLFLQGFWVSNKFGMMLIMCAFLPLAFGTLRNRYVHQHHDVLLMA